MQSNEDHLSRKLAVILHADVVGSTALVHLDETIAHQRITAAFGRFSETIKSYGGVVNEIRGDALVAEFARASDAVSAALAFQQSNSERNTQFDDAIRPDLRVGIALGEVVIADNTVTGPGIVLAQRLEQLADAGGVCVQGSVYEAVPGRLPFEYTTLGEQEVKGFDEPVRAYAVRLKPGEPIPTPEGSSSIDAKSAQSRWQWLAAGVIAAVLIIIGVFAWFQLQRLGFEPASVERMKYELPDRPSIVVLPFENFSSDEEQEYFADGMTEDLITDLSKISGLFVIARSSSFVYKGKDVDARQAAQELSVKYVLEGSVRKAGGRVRINAQLIDATTGGHVWAERYDRELIDIFDLQNQVIEHIVTALAIKLTPQENERITHRSTNDVTAYDHFLRGQVLIRTARYSEAREAYRQATTADSGFARAYGALSITYTFGVQYGWSTDPQRDKDRALVLAKKAVAIDDDVPQAHFALGLAYFINRDHDRAVNAARRAIDLDPGYADAFGLLGWIYDHAGDPEEALRVLEKAKTFNPHLNAGTLGVLGVAHLLTGDLEKAIETFRAQRDSNPELPVAQIYLTAALSRSGRQDDAEWEATELLAQNPHFSVERWVRTQPYKDPTERARLRDDLRRAGLPE